PGSTIMMPYITHFPTPVSFQENHNHMFFIHQSVFRKIIITCSSFMSMQAEAGVKSIRIKHYLKTQVGSKEHVILLFRITIREGYNRIIKKVFVSVLKPHWCRDFSFVCYNAD
ncbi:hypothetical protein OTU49_017143, partial [Cherax quadricarinatus]